MRGEK
jgi:hypothetical protein